jgi:hypothetical protein
MTGSIAARITDFVEHMSAQDMVLNLSYVLNVVTMFLRQMLPLRMGMVVVSCGFFVFALMAGNYSMVAWNVVFLAINIIQVVLLLLEKKQIHLTAELEAIHASLFSSLPRRDFLFLWNMGQERTLATDDYIARKGVPQKTICLILEGTARVEKDGQLIATLKPQSFVGEMSFFTGSAASADVKAQGPLRFNEWSQSHIQALEQLKPDLLNKMWVILGQDLSKKLQR